MPEMQLGKLFEQIIKSIQNTLASPSDDKIIRLFLPNFLSPISYVFFRNLA